MVLAVNAGDAEGSALINRRTFFRAVAGATTLAAIPAIAPVSLKVYAGRLRCPKPDPIIGRIVSGTVTEHPRQSQFVREYERLLQMRIDAKASGNHFEAMRAKTLLNEWMWRSYGKFWPVHAARYCK